MRLCDYQFYWLIPPPRLFHSVQSFSFELAETLFEHSVGKQR